MPLSVLARHLDFPVIFRGFKEIEGWKAFDKWSNWTYLEKKVWIWAFIFEKQKSWFFFFL